MAEPRDSLEATFTLIRRARGGDSGATERLFERYSAYALECARRFAGPALRRRVDPEDLAQSAVAEVWRDFRRFDYRGLGSLDRFVRHVVENKIRDKVEYWRAKRRDAGLDRPIGGGLDRSGDAGRSEPADDLTTTQVVSRSETQQRVRAALARLPAIHARPLELFWLEGLPLEEVAARLSLAGPDAARMRVQRARKALGRILEGKGPA